MRVSELRLEPDNGNEEMSPSSAWRIMQTLEIACDRNLSEGGSVFKENKHHRVKLGRTALAQSLKVAACLFLAIGVGVMAVSALSQTDTWQQPLEEAVASSPVRPFERIEVVCSDSLMTSTSAGVYYGVPVRIFCADAKEAVEIRLRGSQGIRLAAEIPDAHCPPPDRCALNVQSDKRGEFDLFLFVRTPVRPEEFNEAVDANSWDVREAIALVEDLKTTQIEVLFSRGTSVTYSLDTGSLSTREDVAALVHKASWTSYGPLIVSLMREG